MHFPNHFIEKSQFKVVSSGDCTLVRYFHEFDWIRDIQLSIDQLFFVVVISGEIILKTNTSNVRIVKGMSAIINEGPYIMSESLSEQNQDFRAYLFFMPKKNVSNYFENYSKKIKVSENCFPTNVITFNHSEFIESYVQSTSMLFQKPMCQNVLKNILDLKINELLHYFSLNENSNEIYEMLFSSVNNRRTKIEQIVQNNYLNGANIEEMSFLCNMSTSTFKRVFNEVFGMSPGKWLQEKRMTEAIDLLKNSRKNVSETASHCGYKSLSAFSKQFKKVHGVSPSSIH